MAYWHEIKPTSAPVKRLIALGLSITLGFTTICAVVLWESRNRDIDQARQSAANIVATISSEVARNFETTDLSLEAVIDGLNVPGLSALAPNLRQMILFDRAATAKDMGSIFVLNKNGFIIIDSRSETPSAESYAGSDFFKVHQTLITSGSYVSAPWRNAQGEQLIAISRRINDPEGNFAGVVAGTMRLRYFKNIFDRLKVDPRAALTLTRDDGTLIMRAPFKAEIIGANVNKSAVFQKIAQAPEGTFEMIAGIDGVRRMYVYQQIGNLPLTVSFGQSVETLYASWQREAIFIGLLLLALCATNVALIAFLASALRRRAQAEHNFAVMATTDALTGLSNRRRFDESIDLEWRRAQRRQHSVAVLMIDADNFKKFNDQFGHQAGDIALKAIAECIAAAGRRAEDLCARFGGEEFVVLLPDTGIDEAMAVAAKIQSRIASLRALQDGRPDSTPTLSIGVCAMVPFQGLEPRDLVRAADGALYKAKEQGRNRVVAVSPQRGNLKVLAA